MDIQSGFSFTINFSQIRQHMPDEHLGVVDLSLHGGHSNLVVHQERARGHITNITSDWRKAWRIQRHPIDRSMTLICVFLHRDQIQNGRLIEFVEQVTLAFLHEVLAPFRMRRPLPCQSREWSCAIPH